MAEANCERPQSLGFELSIERLARRLGRKGGATGSLDMIELQNKERSKTPSPSPR
jgi:hypothetical protein